MFYGFSNPASDTRNRARLLRRGKYLQNRRGNSRQHERSTKMIAVDFLRNLLKAVPYRIHTVPTGSGIRFVNRACDQYAFRYIFDRICSI